MNNELPAWQPKLVALASAGNGDADGAHDGAHDIHHLHRVWRNAEALLLSYPEADALVVMAACYLHDLVNLPKSDPARAQASRQSAALARRRIEAEGFPPARLDAVAHAIQAHSFSAAIAAQTIEAKIVQDADRLDALGAVGLARLFYTAGQIGSALAHPGDPLAERRPLDDRAFALDHVEAKLAALPTSMQTGAGRALGAQRLEQLLAFRRSFAAEWSGA